MALKYDSFPVTPWGCLSPHNETGKEEQKPLEGPAWRVPVPEPCSAQGCRAPAGTAASLTSVVQGEGSCGSILAPKHIWEPPWPSRAPVGCELPCHLCSCRCSARCVSPGGAASRVSHSPVLSLAWCCLPAAHRAHSSCSSHQGGLGAFHNVQMAPEVCWELTGVHLNPRGKSFCLLFYTILPKRQSQAQNATPQLLALDADEDNGAEWLWLLFPSGVFPPV